MTGDKGGFTELGKYGRELFGLFLIFCALLLFLGIVSFDVNDPSINYVTSQKGVQNKAGLFGAYAAGLLNDFFGIGAFLWPALFAVLGIAHISSTLTLRWWRWCGFFLLTLCVLTGASALDLGIGDLAGGGMTGNTLLFYSTRLLSPIGSFLLWLFIFMAGVQMSANFSWISHGRKLVEKLESHFKSRGFSLPAKLPLNLNARTQAITAAARASLARLRTKAQGLTRLPAPAPESSKIARPLPELADFPAETTLPEDQPAPEDASAEAAPAPVSRQELPALPTSPAQQGDDWNKATSEDAAHVDTAAAKAAQVSPPPEKKQPSLLQKLFQPKTVLPTADLLNPPVPVTAATPQELEAKGRSLMACFQDFDIQGELAAITPGPVVTMFEVRPAPGIRVSRIANLTDDLSLALKAVAVRIQAPIPGTDTVGIEIPNDARETVNFRELVESPEFKKGCGPLTMILGKNIAGHPFMADLTRMPHMLVAGATGAGKSVCLNAILISLLYQLPPERLKLLLIDPKRIEMAVYADLPHLVHPVVTEMDDATNALAWAVEEMETRFKTFMRLGVRNISAYHEKLASFKNAPPEALADLGPLPYMVIVIDELADLMLTAARDVESKIQRLAQLARAAGIHMILATQRPSVDVVTGLIKAQFPCRISFQVSSKHDSRTILDQIGAEHLLGRGDMLFKPPGSGLVRLHGPFLSDEEVQAVVDHWKSQQPPDYQVDFSQWNSDTGRDAPAPGGEAITDALYSEARKFILEQGKISISLLQRHLNIGFNRAARLIGQFEREGLIGGADGSKPRAVIRQPDI